MNYGIKTPPQHCSWQEMLDVWKATDQVDVFSSCWNFDHFYPLVGDPNGACMEAWVTLTALAVNTQRVRVGAMVQGMPYRHPAVTANMAASLDIITGGRLNLGLGAGWHEEEVCGSREQSDLQTAMAGHCSVNGTPTRKPSAQTLPPEIERRDRDR